MQALISNKCVKYVSYDEGSGGQTGEICFLNGEVFDGEIQNGLPKGWGKFTLTDGSYYEGQFDNQGISDGKFVHFTRDCYEGKFLRDRFEAGTIHFCDGDKLEGEWGNERAKWVLKHGELSNEDNIHAGSFGRGSELTRYESKGKEVLKTDSKAGFYVNYDKCLIPERPTIRNLLFTADGTTQFEDHKSSSIVEKVVNRTSSQLPFVKTDYIDNRSLTKTMYQFCYGFKVETDKDGYNASVGFKDLSNISALGQFELDKFTFKFNGELRYKNNRIGDLNLKRSTFGGLKIKFGDREFEDLNIFSEHIGDHCAKDFNDVTVHSGLRPATRKKSQKSAEVMKDMITDIKQHSDCVIM